MYKTLYSCIHWNFIALLYSCIHWHFIAVLYSWLPGSLLVLTTFSRCVNQLHIITSNKSLTVVPIFSKFSTLSRTLFYKLIFFYKLANFQLLPWPLKQPPPPPLLLLGNTMSSLVFAVLTPARTLQTISILLWNRKASLLLEMMRNLSEENILLQSSWKQ